MKTYYLPIPYYELDGYRNAMYFDEEDFKYLLQEVIQSVFNRDCRAYLDAIENLVQNDPVYSAESQDIQNVADTLYRLIYPHLHMFILEKTSIYSSVYNINIEGGRVFIEVQEEATIYG